MTKHKIVMTTEECFEVVQILQNYIQDKKADKDLLSAYNKFNICDMRCPSSEMNYDYEIPIFNRKVNKA